MSRLLVVCLAVLAGSSCWALPSRIVGGQPTTIDQYPSIVLVERFWAILGQWSSSCGANVISNVYLLSAAHCFPNGNSDTSTRRIRAGSTYRTSGGIIINFARIINHPSYGQNGYDGDIAVVRLATALVYSDVIRPIAIPPQGTTLPDNLPVVHAGWGTTIAGVSSSVSNVLRDVEILTINNRQCADIYWTRRLLVTENMICAGVPGGGRDACQGDSGGPLYYGDILVGVVSWGIGCGDVVFPGVSAAVAPYTNWIVATAV